MYWKRIVGLITIKEEWVVVSDTSNPGMKMITIPFVNLELRHPILNSTYKEFSTTLDKKVFYSSFQLGMSGNKKN